MKKLPLLFLFLMTLSCVDEEAPELGISLRDSLPRDPISNGSAQYEDYSNIAVNVYVSFTTVYNLLGPNIRSQIESIVVIKPDRRFELSPDRTSFFDGNVRRNRERCYRMFFELKSGERLEEYKFCVTPP